MPFTMTTSFVDKCLSRLAGQKDTFQNIYMWPRVVRESENPFFAPLLRSDKISIKHYTFLTTIFFKLRTVNTRNLFWLC
jgi:hypothetical protein